MCSLKMKYNNANEVVYFLPIKGVAYEDSYSQ